MLYLYIGMYVFLYSLGVVDIVCTYFASTLKLIFEYRVVLWFCMVLGVLCLCDHNLSPRALPEIKLNHVNIPYICKNHGLMCGGTTIVPMVDPIIVGCKSIYALIAISVGHYMYSFYTTFGMKWHPFFIVISDATIVNECIVCMNDARGRYCPTCKVQWVCDDCNMMWTFSNPTNIIWPCCRRPRRSVSSDEYVMHRALYAYPHLAKYSFDEAWDAIRANRYFLE
jgi:hypothetical protein